MIKFLGQTIAFLRKEQGYSSDELASLVGVTNQTIIRWENNISKPKIINVIKLSDIFNVSVHSIFNF